MRPHRTIPISREIAKMLKAMITNQKIRPSSGEIFVNRKGNLWVKDALTWRWQRTLPRAAEQTKCARLDQVPARKLRATFATMAGQLGVPDRLLKAYMGHSPVDILGGHYRRIDPAEMRVVSDRMEGWRKLKKVKPQVWQKSGNLAPSSVSAIS